VAQAEKLWRSLESFSGGTLALGMATPICKCPPSPLEGILLAEQLIRRRGLRDKTRLIFFTPYPRAYPARPMNEIVEPILKERGVEIRTFFDLDRVDPITGVLYSIEGEEIQTDLPIIIPAFRGADIVYTPDDVADPDHFIITDKTTLKVRGLDGAYAIGDATNLPTSKSGVGAHLEAHIVARALMGQPTLFSGRTHCPMDLGHGQGTFVIGSYDAPVVRLHPSRFKHFMKMMFERIYWMSLRGTLDVMFDVYFRMTAPKPSPGPAVHRTV
jgi:sulfide:quinone oxidoreductase